MHKVINLSTTNHCYEISPYVCIISNKPSLKNETLYQKTYHVLSYLLEIHAELKSNLNSAGYFNQCKKKVSIGGGGGV